MHNSIGLQVQGFDRREWTVKKFKMMEEIIFCKFTSGDGGCYKTLLSTYPAYLGYIDSRRYVPSL